MDQYDYSTTFIQTDLNQYLKLSIVRLLNLGVLVTLGESDLAIGSFKRELMKKYVGIRLNPIVDK
jgi:hypothetical protein